MIKKNFIIFLLFGTLSSLSSKTFAFFEDTFLFETDDGDQITIYKSKSYCFPKEVVNVETRAYGVAYKTFFIYPRCVFRGKRETYAGITYKYDKYENCSTNKFICKAAGKFDLLNKKYWRKRNILEKKIKLEVDQFNIDFEERTILAKKKFYKERRLDNIYQSYIYQRDNCLRYKDSPEFLIKPDIREHCSSYMLLEKTLKNEGIKLPYESFTPKLKRLYYQCDVHSFCFY